MQHKIKCQYIGSQMHDYIPQLSQSVVLVSCSNIRDVKRVYLIAEALQHINIPVTWYHIGDQNLAAKNDPTIEQYQYRNRSFKTESKYSV